MVRQFLAVLLLSLVVGCSNDLENYKEVYPQFNLFQYFEGTTMAWGMVQDYSEQQTRRFEVVIEGSVENDVLTLTEDFVFADGEVTKRVWVIERLENGEYIGRADDIIGVATGKELGNALQWQYDFELVMEDSSVVVSFDDWMYRQDEKHVFNLTKIKKFGIEVGQITLFFQKE
ncbi:hypothetical protein AKJ18_03800 [Vibrio xuii]|nr:hypothetical protein AKJ18_03800 [Vibrio xuii]